MRIRRSYRFEFIVIILIVFLGAAIAGAGQVNLAWDPNDPDPEGYRVFSRLANDSYDYSAPLWEGPQTTTGGIEIGSPAPPAPAPAVIDSVVWDKANSTILVDWNQPTNETSQVDFFVVRAYEGELESADSEEVSYTQTAPAVTDRWEIFFGDAVDGPWTPIDVIQAAGGTRTTAPFTAVRPGEIKTVFFTIVTFAADGQFSGNATPMSVVVDRDAPPDPPSGIRVQAFIPVQ